MIEILLGNAVAQLLRGVKSADPTLLEIQAWVSHLIERAPGRWRAVLVSGISCDIQGRQGACPRPAVGSCVICRKPTCLEHSFASAGADVACFRCVRTAAGAAGAGHATGYDPPQASPAKTPPDPRKAHLKTLGLGVSATNEDVHDAFKKIARRNHPDRLLRSTPARRAAAETRFKAASEAYHWLTAHEARAA